MRRRALLSLVPNETKSAPQPRTQAQIARRAMVMAHGPKTAGWIINQHRKQFHASGVVDFKVPEKPKPIVANKLRWFFIAMDYLQQKDENGDRVRAQWEVDVFISGPGTRTFRVKWLTWKSWKREKPRWMS